MKIIITSYPVGQWAANYICSRFAQASKRPFVLGLPTGSTVEEMYRTLVDLEQHHKIDFSHIHTFNMDEYQGLPPSHPQSYAYYMHHHLFDQVQIPASHIHLLPSHPVDVAQTCLAYEQAMRQVGGIDLFLGGVGRNGHLAFNEPGSSFDSRTRLIELTPSTRQANSRFFNHDINQVPTHALTVGIGTILQAKELLFLATGTAKAQAVARLASGPFTTQWPITALKTHPHATLLIDAAAASALSGAIQLQWQHWHSQHPTHDFIFSL